MSDPLPIDDLPIWYGVETDEGWTAPKTDQLKDPEKYPELTNAWNGEFKQTENKINKAFTITIDGLYPISPIQVGGGSFPEGLILPAQIGGMPCIPGSSLRGAFLNWIDTQFESMPEAEQKFWSKLMSRGEKRGWLPHKIRFETTWIETLKAYPLNPQQDWQIFGDEQDRDKLAIQWQVEAKKEENSNNQEKWRRVTNSRDYCYSVSIVLRDSNKRNLVKQQLEQMLLQQGIGRGTSTGFGRLAKDYPQNKTWQIELEGMKPAIQSRLRSKKHPEKNVEGEYRWSPQVIKACLRGYFTRLALDIMSIDEAKKITNIIFGGFGNVAKLKLTSYLVKGRTKTQQSNIKGKYDNIPKDITDTVWHINVNCNKEWEDLVEWLLSLASKLGGLGAGWRRPNHDFRNGSLYRGSSFKVKCQSNSKRIREIIGKIHNFMQQFAQNNQLSLTSPQIPNIGSIASIWQCENPEKWRDIVHNTCRTAVNNKPYWCGSNERPSNYAIKKGDDYCRVTVFHQIESMNKGKKSIEDILKGYGFRKIKLNY